MGADPAIRTVRIFLASSAELADHRREFESFIGRQNNLLVERGVFLKLIQWEDFIDAMSATRLQDEYNRALQQCELFVMLFRTKVGRYTAEEFEKAFGQFKATGWPRIWTYFNDAPVTTGQVNRADMNSLWDFQEKLRSLGHFQTPYANDDALCRHFGEQLQKLEGEGLLGRSSGAGPVVRGTTAPTAGALPGPQVSSPGPEDHLPGIEGNPTGGSSDSLDSRMLQRLREGAKGLDGEFGRALCDELAEQFPRLMCVEGPGHDVVANCFAKAPAEDVDGLFYALDEARGRCKYLRDDESNVLATLMVYAATRAINPIFWTAPPLASGGDSARHSCVNFVPTSSSLLAAVGFAGIHGLVLRAGASKSPDGVYDLSDAALSTDVSESVLRVLYDEAAKSNFRLIKRSNPDSKLSTNERGALRNHFDGLRRRKAVSTVYVRMPALDSAMQCAVLAEVAAAINSRVVLGAVEHDAQLTVAATNITPGSLLAKVADLLTGLSATNPAGNAETPRDQR